MSPHCIPAGVIAWLAFLPHLAAAEPPAAQGRDRYGDPLPPGVIARLGTERLTVVGQPIFLTFSPDGRRLAAQNGAENLRVWDVASGREVLRLKTPRLNSYGPGMRPLAFSPDGKALAVGCADRAVRVWEVPTGRELRCFAGLPRAMAHLAFAPDGRSLFAGGYGGPVRCWDLTGAGAPRTFGDFHSVSFLAVSPDGKTLTAATPEPRQRQKQTFVCWDVASGKELRRHTLTTSGGWAGSLSPDGGALAAPDADGKSIAVLDPLTGRERARIRGTSRPSHVAFAADGKTLTCSSQDGTARVWGAETGKLRAQFKALATSFGWVALSPDGEVLALSGRADYAVHLWDVAAGRELRSFPGRRGGPLAVAFVGDGREVATVSRDSSHVRPYVKEWADWSLRRWDAATGAERAVVSHNPKGEVHLTAFSPDGRRLATVIHDGTLRLWDVEPGKELRSWEVPTATSTANISDRQGRPISVRTPHPAVSQPVFTADGRWLLAAAGPAVHRWEVATGKKLAPLRVEGVTEEHTWCAPSPDGRTLVVWAWGGRGGVVVLVEADTGKLLHRLGAAVRDGANRPAFSPDGRTLAVDDREEVTLWEVASGRPRGRLPLGVRNVFVVLAFSPDGRLLAAGGVPEAPVVLWDLATGAVVGRLRADLGRVETLSFSPDGTRLAVAGYASAALVCDVAALCGKKALEQVVKLPAPTEDRLEELWADLAGADGARAYRAVLRLGAAGTKGAALLKRRLKGAPAPDATRIARLIADLDSDDFATREKATAALEALGTKAGSALRRAVENAASAEVRTRAGRLLARLGEKPGALPSPELVRLRAVEALEANGTPEARAALAELAAGPAADALTREAKASLQRLARRARPPDAHDRGRGR